MFLYLWAPAALWSLSDSFCQALGASLTAHRSGAWFWLSSQQWADAGASCGEGGGSEMRGSRPRTIGKSGLQVINDTEG